MSIFGVEFQQAFRGDAVLLGDRQGVVGVVEVDDGALACCARLDPAALVDRFGKAPEAVREPAAPRACVAVSAAVEAVDVAAEILAREGGPDAEAEPVAQAVDRDRKDAADEEMLAADHAEIFGQEIAVEPQRAIGFQRAGSVPMIGRVRGDVEHAPMDDVAIDARPADRFQDFEGGRFRTLEQLSEQSARRHQSCSRPPEPI